MRTEDGPARGKLQQLFANTPTTFTGYLHGEELARAYASADIFLFASQYEAVGKRGITAIEIENNTISLLYWFDREGEKKHFSHNELPIQELENSNY